ncbi:MAG: GtrA family protein [Patescibacteria group bacterium]
MPISPRMWRIVKYLLAGGMGVSLYYLLLYVLTEYAGFWYLASAAIGGAANYVSNFLFQKFWTFGNKDRAAVKAQAKRYAILFISLGLTNLALMFILVTLLHVWYIAAQIPVTLLLTIVGYRITRKIFST